MRLFSRSGPLCPGGSIYRLVANRHALYDLSRDVIPPYTTRTFDSRERCPARCWSRHHGPPRGLTSRRHQQNWGATGVWLCYSGDHCRDRWSELQHTTSILQEIATRASGSNGIRAQASISTRGLPVYQGLRWSFREVNSNNMIATPPGARTPPARLWWWWRHIMTARHVFGSRPWAYHQGERSDWVQ